MKQRGREERRDLKRRVVAKQVSDGKQSVKSKKSKKSNGASHRKQSLQAKIQLALQAVFYVPELTDWMCRNHGHVDSGFTANQKRVHYASRLCSEHGLLWKPKDVSSMLGARNQQRVMDLLGIQARCADTVAFVKCLFAGLRGIMSSNMISRVHQYPEVQKLNRLLRKYTRTTPEHEQNSYDTFLASITTGCVESWLIQHVNTVRCNGAVSGWTEMQNTRYMEFVAKGLMDTLTCVGSQRYVGYRSMYMCDRRTGGTEYEKHKLHVSGYGVQRLVLTPKHLLKFNDEESIRVPAAVSNKTNRNTESMSAFIVDFDDLVCQDTQGAGNTMGCQGLRGLRNLLNWLDSNNVGYLVHSTSKHTWKNPRLRVLVPLNKRVIAGKYKSMYEALMRVSGCVGYDAKCMSLHRYFVDPKLHATKHPVFFIRAGGCLNTVDMRKEMRDYATQTVVRNLERLNPKGALKAKRSDTAGVQVFPANLVSAAVDNIARTLTASGIEYRMGYSSGKPLLYVQCVNHRKHTKTKSTDTYITVNTETSHMGLPLYYCSHASCANLNKQKALESFLGDNVVDYSVLSRKNLLGVVRQFLQGSVPGVFNRVTNAYPKCLVTNPGTKDSVVLTTDSTSAGLVAEAIAADSDCGALYERTNMLDVVKEYIGRKLHSPCSAHPMLCHVGISGYGVVGDEIRRVVSSGFRLDYKRAPGNRHYGIHLGSNQDHPIVHIVTGCYGEDTVLLAEHFSGIARVVTRRTINAAKIEPSKVDSRIMSTDTATDFYNRANARDMPWIHRRALPVTILDWTRRKVRTRGSSIDISKRAYDGRQTRVLEDIDDVFRCRVRGLMEALHLGGQGIMVVCCHNLQDAMRFRKAIGIRSDGITSLNKFKKAIGFVESDGFGNRNWNGSPVSVARLVTTVYRNDKYVNKRLKPENRKKGK